MVANKSNSSIPSKFFGDAQTFLNGIPCAASLWTADRANYLFNASANSLTGFQERDPIPGAETWANQVHEDDRDRFRDFVARIDNSQNPRSCDYRFLPRGATKPIWIREISATVTTETVNRDWKVISLYIDISDLESHPPADGQKTNLNDIIDELFHDAQNGIHRVGMELELARLGLEKGSDAVQTTEMINVLEHTVRDLRSYITCLHPSWPDCDPAAVLDAVVANRQMGSLRRRVNIVWIPANSIPHVPMHAKLLARVIERILDVCENSIEERGELRIAAGQRHCSDKLRAEIKLKMFSTTAIPLQGDQWNSEEPAANNPRRRGIDRALRVLRRHNGEVSFRKDTDRQCEITILL